MADRAPEKMREARHPPARDGRIVRLEHGEDLAGAGPRRPARRRRGREPSRVARARARGCATRRSLPSRSGRSGRPRGARPLPGRVRRAGVRDDDLVRERHRGERRRQTVLLVLREDHDRKRRAHGADISRALSSSAVRLLALDLGPGMRGGQRQSALLLVRPRRARPRVRLLARRGAPLARAAPRAPASTPSRCPPARRPPRSAPRGVARAARAFRPEIVYAGDARGHGAAVFSRASPRTCRSSSTGASSSPRAGMPSLAAEVPRGDALSRRLAARSRRPSRRPGVPGGEDRRRARRASRTTRSARARRLLRLPSGSCTPGAFDGLKGQDVVGRDARAARAPAASTRRALFLGDGPARAAVEAPAPPRAASRTAASFAGQVGTTPRARFAASHLMLLPSASEGGPLVLVEAMAAGCPVVGARRGRRRARWSTDGERGRRSSRRWIPTAWEEAVRGVLLDPGREGAPRRGGARRGRRAQDRKHGRAVGGGAPRRARRGRVKTLVRATNWVGDVVMSRPALRALKAADPVADASPSSRARGSRSSTASRTRSTTSSSTTPRDGTPGERAARASRRRCATAGFDRAVILPTSFSTALVLARAGVPRAHRLPRRGPRPAPHAARSASTSPPESTRSGSTCASPRPRARRSPRRRTSRGTRSDAVRDAARARLAGGGRRRARSSRRTSRPSRTPPSAGISRGTRRSSTALSARGLPVVLLGSAGEKAVNARGGRPREEGARLRPERPDDAARGARRPRVRAPLRRKRLGPRASRERGRHAVGRRLRADGPRRDAAVGRPARRRAARAPRPRAAAGRRARRAASRSARSTTRAWTGVTPADVLAAADVGPRRLAVRPRPDRDGADVERLARPGPRVRPREARLPDEPVRAVHVHEVALETYDVRRAARARARRRRGRFPG